MKRLKLTQTIFTLIAFLLLAAQVSAQRTVTGTVQDAQNQTPLSGATVAVSSKNTVSGADGKFSISVPNGKATITVSFVGYETRSIAVGENENNIIVNLDQSSTAQLDDVVIIGYGAQKKSDLTGAITSLKADDLNLGGTVSNTAQALQGKAAGVMVIQNSKAPGENSSVRIRGSNSISSTNEPLYVVDGFPTSNGTDINPSDIASMEILKDASATAIYGARGANGVILITTKRGQAGKSVISYDAYFGSQKVENPFKMLSAKDYMLLSNELYKEIEGQQNTEFGAYTQSQLNSTVNTNWVDAASRNGKLQSHNLQFQGGNDKTKILTSLGYFNQQGVLKNTDFERYSARVNVDHKVNEFIKAGASVYGQRSNSNIQDYDGNILQSNVLLGILTYDPTVPVYNEDGTFGRPPGGRGDNPVANLLGRQNELVKDRVNGLGYVEIKPIESITARVNGGIELSHYFTGKYLPRSTYQGGIDGGVASTNDYSLRHQLFDATVTYAKTFNEVHSVSVLGGYGYEKNVAENRGIAVKGFSTDLFSFNNLGAASTITGVSSAKSENILISVFGRVNYSYSDKYLLTFTLRQDGSSRFGADHRWGSFPSGAVAWRIDREGFMENQKLFSNLKLRLGYGKTGNDQIGNYAAFALMANTRVTFDGATNTGGTHLNQSTPENPSLKWETTDQYNAGLDIGFFDSRLSLTLDAYYKKTTDLLLRKSLPLYSGFSSGQSNVGAMENKGFEVTVESRNLVNTLKWETSLNFAVNRNKILALADAKDIFLTSSKPLGTVSEEQFAVLRVGESLGSLYGYVYDGVLQQNENYAPQPNAQAGDPKFKDISGPEGKPDGKIDNNDRTIIGSASPDYIFGLTNNFSYKNFDLNISIHGSVGNQLLNMTRMNLEWKRTTDAEKRWTPENTNTDIPRNGFFYSKYGGYINSHFIEDASFLRVRSITLGYTYPSTVKYFKSVRLYASAENLFTLTSYTGWDPEVDTKGYEANAAGGQGANAGAGMDFNAYPSMRSFTVGLNIQF